MSRPLPPMTEELARRLAGADIAFMTESLAGIVRRLVRAADLVGLVTAQPAVRILLMNAELKGAQMVIDRILAELAGSIFVRWGLACFPATVRTADDLLAQADAAAGLAAS